MWLLEHIAKHQKQDEQREWGGCEQQNAQIQTLIPADVP
jgi:hypothetical protein